MIKGYDPGIGESCREFLDRHPDANYGHDPAWGEVFREAYGKRTLTFVHVDDKGAVTGLASASILASAVFGRKLVAMPYLDYGGPLGADAAAETALRSRLLDEARERRLALEIRSLLPQSGLASPDNEKVAMILPISGASEEYWKRLDAKVRNQVRKAEKSGVTVTWGGPELLDDFYRVFTVNMRDLGSPTHSRAFFVAVLKHFPKAEIGVAYRAGRPIGCLFRIGWKRTLVIPWASTLKEERQYCPNNALYWESLRTAFERGLAEVDFGRSTREEGTYKFKRQWLAEERPLHWYPFDAAGNPAPKVEHAATGRMGWAKGLWARLPLPLANALGPRVRGYISA
jgi:FemAB-related protein (PEP-CTERM system-associated)